MTWRLAESLVRLRDEIDARWPDRSRVADGTIGDKAHSARASRHNPNRAGVVTALDVTHDPAGGLDVHALARALVARQIEGSGHPDLAYVVSDGAIASRAHGWRWRAYRGSNPHTGHAHFAVGTGPDADPWQPYDSGDAWGVADGPEIEESTVTAPDDVRYWQRILAASWPAPHDDKGPPYDLGPAGADGIVGPRTRAAIEDWQRRRGIAVTGTLTLTTCATLQSHANRAHATQEARRAAQ